MATILAGPRGRPLTGCFFPFRRDPLGFLERTVAEHGDFTTFRMGPQRMFLVNRPDLVEELLITRAACFEKGRALKRTRSLLGNGLLTAEGELHLRQRRALQPSFHRQRMEGYGRVMAELAARHASAWTPGEPLDLAREMNRLTLAVVSRTLFGMDMDHASEEVAEALTVTVNMFNLLLMPFAELLEKLPLPGMIRYRRARERLNRVIAGMIEARRRGGAASQGAGDDLLAVLVTAGMSDQQVRDEALTLFLAGHETTANALAWTFHLLSSHPEAEARLVEEVAALPPDRPAGPEDLPRLEWARRVVAESMRLYPPAWVVGRLAVADTELGGVEVPRGSLVMASQWTMHRKAEFFPDPLRFDPSRPGLGGSPAGDARLPKFAWFPFGGGTRVCIGEHFAWTEALLVLAEVTRRWRFEPLPEPPVVPQPVITLRLRHGLPMVPHRRY